MIERLNRAMEGRYRTERELGEGGMATVYLAEDLKHKRKVAIKVLRPELAAVVGAERFLAEIETTANLQHPNILPLFDSGEADGLLFYVMPYVEGESLRERLEREKQLPVDEAVGIAAAVGHALAAAHEEGVIHRDIKPANILLSRGQPLVADFGIALAVQQAGGGRLTETGLSLGTPYYMSPEQATGDRMVTAGTDVYALGCVLYEMLVGEPPYVGSTAQAVLGKILTDKPRSPTAVRSAIRPNVEAAVLKALEKLPADRFATATGFVRALEDPSFRHGGPAGDTGEGRGVSPAWRVAALAASVVAVALAAVLASGRTGRAPADTIRFELSTPAGVDIYSSQGIGLDLAPDGRSLVFIGATEGESRLWIRHLDQLDPRPVPGTSSGRNPRFSPRGDALAFSSEGRLLTVSLTGTPPLTLIPDSVQGGGGGIAWGDDGFIYVTREGGDIWRIAEGGGTPEMVLERGEDGAAQWPEVLPDGRGLLFTRDLGTPQNDRIELLDLETGETRSLFPGANARWSATGHILVAVGDGTLVAVPFDPEGLEITGPQRPVTEGVQVNGGSASQFAVSRSGTLVFLPGGASLGGSLTWVNGEAPGRPPDHLPQGSFAQPAVSPDGNKIALVHSAGSGTPGVWVLDLRDGAFTRITFQGQNGSPFWSPDGREIGFLSDRDGTPAIYSRPVDMSTEARVLRRPSEDRDVVWARWTPDGRRLIYNLDYRRIVHAPPHPDSAEVEFAAAAGFVLSFAVSPDGKWLAYTSGETGGPEVYIRPFPGPGGQRQISVGGGRGPRWMPDGQSLIYQVDGQDVWVRARLRTGGDFGVVERETYADGGGVYSTEIGSFDLAPDGRVLGVNMGTRLSARGFVVTANWGAEMRALEGR